MNSGAPQTLPKLVLIVIGLLAGAENREYLLGDLQEEYSKRSFDRNARLWLWHEVITTIPGLLVIRLRQIEFRSLGMTIFITVLAYLGLMMWGAYVTRPIMIGLRDGFPDSQSIDYLFWYLPVRITGMFLVASIIACLSFRNGAGFSRNFRQRLMPLLLVITIPQFWIWAFSNYDYSLIDSLVRVSVDIMALVLGGIFGGWLKNQRIKK